VTGAATCLHPGGLELTDRLVAAAGLRAGAAVLDIGCGAGAAVAHLTDAHGLRATGLDASRERAEQAAEARPDLDFVAGRAEALPFPPRSFDAVLCECVLSTLGDAGRALAEMARVLRPDGAALVSDVYTRAGDERPRDAGPRESGPRDAGPRDAGTSSLGSPATVAALFDGAGLRVVLWADEPSALGRYLWDHAGARDAGPARLSAAGPARPRPITPPRGRRLGYFSCVARPSSSRAQGAADG
jgi:SAM-dependent methyltransferase